VEMILLDWTRLGRTFCLAGVVLDDLTLRVLRPLPIKHRGAASRTVGWSPYLLEGHARWDVFELVKPEPANAAPPHAEDVWVRSLRPRRRSASKEQRRMILAATATNSSADLFGAVLAPSRANLFLEAGTGSRSLATLIVPSARIRFAGSWRKGAFEPDVRVTLPIFEFGDRDVPVKDHQLLLKAEQAGSDMVRKLEYLNAGVHAMGDRVAVRLGLSRAFVREDTTEPERCWLMADGFFSLTDPEP